MYLIFEFCGSPNEKKPLRDCDWASSIKMIYQSINKAINQNHKMTDSVRLPESCKNANLSSWQTHCLMMGMLRILLRTQLKKQLKLNKPFAN